MLQRGDFDLMYVARLLEIFDATGPQKFPTIHRTAECELAAVERNLAKPNNEQRARRV